MDKFREDIIKVREQMEEVINENLEALKHFNNAEKSIKDIWKCAKYNQSRHTILVKACRVKYEDTSILVYFVKADIEKQKVIVETLLKSNNYEVMERVVIKMLNCLGIERKEQLDNIFKGMENLITENIEKRVKVELRSSRIKRNLIENTICTAWWAIILILSYEGFDTLATMNIDYILVPILFAIPLFLLSSLTQVTRGMYNYREALNIERGTQKQ